MLQTAPGRVPAAELGLNPAEAPHTHRVAGGVVRRFTQILVVIGLLLAVRLFAAVNMERAPREVGAFAPDELLVKFKTGASQKTQAREEHSAELVRTFRSGAEHWRLPSTADLSEAIDSILTDTAVAYAHPNYVITSGSTFPDDPNFGLQWSLYNAGQTNGTPDADIDAEFAWDIERGDAAVTVAVIDGGIDYTHDDLEANMWENSLEVGGVTGFDDDGCGYVDDQFGWDFVQDDSDPIYDLNQPPLTRRHASRVAGIVAADANNNLGIAGVMWEADLMNLKILQGFDANTPTGWDGLISDAIAAIDYATCMSVDVINASWGIIPPAPCQRYSSCAPALRDAIQEAGEREIAFIVASHNQNWDIDDPTDPNHFSFPCNYDLANIICVASTDADDAPAGNFGVVSVDLAAPGEGVYTTNISNSYSVIFGTSFAAPHVAGVVGLMRSLSRDIPVTLIRQQLLDPGSLDLLPDLDPNDPSSAVPVVTGGRLNAHKAIVDYDSSSPAAITNLAASSIVCTNSIALQWTSTGDDGSAGGPASLNQVRVSENSITAENWRKAFPASNAPAPASPGTIQSMTFGSLKPSTSYYFRMRSFDEWGNGPLSNQVSKTTHDLCTASYCLNAGERCYSTGCGPATCCYYNCIVDASCTAPDPCPEDACGCL